MTPDAAVLKRLAAAEPAHAETMSRHRTEVTTMTLPFYQQYRWLRFVVYLPWHPWGLDCLDNGERIVPLGADAETVYRVNDEERLQLRDEQVVPYVRFFLTITGEKGDTLVAQPSDVPWLPTTERDQALRTKREAISKIVHAALVSRVADGYRVSFQIVRLQDLLELSLSVSLDGRVRTLGSKTLAEDLPVHDFD